MRIDRLKIDRSFIANLEADERASALLQGMVDLAHGLGMEVVAEGIETDDQLQTVRRLGCDTGQGYLLGRPAPPSVVTGSIERERGVGWRTLNNPKHPQLTSSILTR